MKNVFLRVATVLLALALLTGATRSHAIAPNRTTEPTGWYNSDYIYALTRGLNDMDAHPGVKVTLVPLTLALDTAFLPFALVVGLFGH